MIGSKRTMKKHRKHELKAPYWQDWMHIDSRTLRKRLKSIEVDIADGASYRKIGTWFEWN